MSIMLGVELLREHYKSILKKKEDIYVLHVHWILIKNNFLCVGTGDEKILKGDEKKSELLPCDWNSGSCYVLRYVKGSDLYLLRIITMGNDAVVNLIRAEDMKIVSVVIPMVETMDELTYDVVDFKEMCEKFDKNMFATLCPEKAKTEIKKTKEGHSILVEPSPIRDLPGRFIPHSPILVPGVGRADLDPLAGLMGVGGGNIMNPHSQRYAGFRHDPLYPDIDGTDPRMRPRGPNPDHMGMPNFGHFI